MDINKAKEIIISEFGFDANGFFNKLMRCDFDKERFDNLLMAFKMLRLHELNNSDWDFILQILDRQSNIIINMISVSKFVVYQFLEDEKKTINGVDGLEDIAEKITILFLEIRMLNNDIDSSIGTCGWFDPRDFE